MHKACDRNKKKALVFPKPMFTSYPINISSATEETRSLFTSTPLSPTGAKKSKIDLNYSLIMIQNSKV